MTGQVCLTGVKDEEEEALEDSKEMACMPGYDLLSEREKKVGIPCLKLASIENNSVFIKTVHKMDCWVYCSTLPSLPAWLLTDQCKYEQTGGQQNSIKKQEKRKYLAAQWYKAKEENGCRKRGLSQACASRPSGFARAMLFSYEAGVANSCRILHLWAAVSMLD